MGAGRARAAVVAILGLVAAGCGDDDGQPQTAFVDEANAICRAGTERIDELFRSTFRSPEDVEDPEKQEAVKAAIAEDIARQIDELRDIEPPEDVEDDFERVLDDAEDVLDDVRDMSAEELFAAEDDPFEEVNAQLEELGLSACADDGADGGGGGSSGD